MKWYIGGHSLGGSMAASYLSENREDFAKKVIDGGSHAYFGMYGSQEGHGVATISNEEQILLTTEAVVEFVGIED